MPCWPHRSFTSVSTASPTPRNVSPTRVCRFARSNTRERSSVTHEDDESTHAIRWDEHDLVPAVVQDANTFQVLMVGFMNQTAFQESLATHKVHFFSRSRNRLWRKGETSGNELHLEEIRVNCEQNSLLIFATPAGPTCHTGHDSCYFRRVEYDERLTVLAE